MHKVRLSLRFKPAAKMVALTMSLATQVAAQDAATNDAWDAAKFVEETGGDQRINYSGKLRMLSQRLPAAACNLHDGIDPSSSRAALDGALEEFDEILAALEFGDDTRGIYGPEQRRRTLRVIEEVHKTLAPIKDALANEPTEGVSSHTAQILADENLALLEIAKMLVVDLTGAYANPVALLQSDAMTIDIAGRQRMLTQKMSKEVCLVLSNIHAPSASETLGETMRMFEVSLGALQNGMSEVGIQPPPNGAITDGLAVVAREWGAVRAHIDTVLLGGTLTAEERAVVFNGLSTTLREMNTVVGMYADASKLNL